MTNQVVGLGSPRSRFREMMRIDILNAGREILLADGYPSLSMRALAEAVGVRAPTLYDYFASKEDVLNALFLEAVEDVRAKMQVAVASSPPGVARLVGMSFAYRDFAVSSPVLFQLIFGRIDPGYIPGEEQMLAGHGLYLVLRIEVETAVQLGEIEPGDIDILSMTIWSAVHGVATLEHAGFMAKCGPESPTDISAYVVSSLLNGLTPRSTGDLPRIRCSYPATSA